VWLDQYWRDYCPFDIEYFIKIFVNATPLFQKGI
jgi:hypothetical protein